MPRHNGFTLIELLVVVTITAILIAAAAPSFSSLLADYRLNSSSNSLLAALKLARSEARMRQSSVAVCGSSDQSTCNTATDWSQGIIVIQSSLNKVLRVLPASSTDNITVTAAQSSISYASNGTTSASSITLTDSRDESITIKVNKIGHACSGSSCS